MPSIHGAVQIDCDIYPGGLRTPPVVAVASSSGHCFCYVTVNWFLPSQSY